MFWRWTRRRFKLRKTTKTPYFVMKFAMMLTKESNGIFDPRILESIFGRLRSVKELSSSTCRTSPKQWSLQLATSSTGSFIPTGELNLPSGRRKHSTVKMWKPWQGNWRSLSFIWGRVSSEHRGTIPSDSLLCTGYWKTGGIMMPRKLEKGSGKRQKQRQKRIGTITWRHCSTQTITTPETKCPMFTSECRTYQSWRARSIGTLGHIRAGSGIVLVIKVL